MVLRHTSYGDDDDDDIYMAERERERVGVDDNQSNTEQKHYKKSRTELIFTCIIVTFYL